MPAANRPDVLAFLRPTIAAVLLSIAAIAPAAAMDLTGLTMRAIGVSERSSSSTQGDITFPLEIYFGEKGTRFVGMTGYYAKARVAIPAGEKRGIFRRNFVAYEVTLQQSSSSVQVKIIARGSPYEDSWTFNIGVGNGTCNISAFRYTPDPRLLMKVHTKPGSCSLTRGVPEGLADQ